MSNPTAAYQELAQYSAASGTNSSITAASTYLENLSASISKTIANHKLTIGLGIGIAAIVGIGTYYYLKKHKKVR